MLRPARPTLEEIQHYLRGAPFANWADRARTFAAAETLEPKDHKEYLRTLLYPGRFYYSWMTGLMGSNDASRAGCLSFRNATASMAQASICRRSIVRAGNSASGSAAVWRH